MTQLTRLNNFLIEIANADKVGIRRKILTIRRYIDNVGDAKSTCGRIVVEENHCAYNDGSGVVDLAWTCFIDGQIMGAIWKRDGVDDGYWLIISHEGDDHRVNESKWVKVFEDITDNLPKEGGKTKLFKTHVLLVDAMSRILKEKGL